MARDFDGVSDNATTGLTDTVLGTPFTLAGWVWFDAAGISTQVIWSVGNSILVDAGVTDLRWQQDTGAFPFTGCATSRSSGQWYHLAVTSTGSGAGNTKIYLNGTQADNGANGGSLQSGSLYFAKQVGASPRYFNGKLAEIGVWSAVLDAAEIASLNAGMVPGLVRPTSLVGWWQLVGRASPEPDWKGGNDATLSGTLNFDHPRIFLRSRKTGVFITSSPPPPTLPYMENLGAPGTSEPGWMQPGGTYYNPATGNTYTQNFSGTLGLSATLTKRVLQNKNGSLSLSGTRTNQTNKPLTASLGLAGTFAKLFPKSFVGALGLTGVFTKTAKKSLTDNLGLSASLARSTSKSLIGSLPLNGVFAKAFPKTFSGTLGLSGNLVKKDQKTLTGTLSLTATRTNQVLKSLTGSLSLTGNFTKIKVVVKNLTGSLPLSGVLTNLVKKTYSATLALSGLLMKQANKGLTGSLPLTGNFTKLKVVLKTFTPTLALAGTLTRLVKQSLIGSLPLVGVLQKQVNKPLIGSLPLIGNLTRAKIVTKSLTGSLTLTGATLLKTVSKLYSSTFPLAGVLVRRTDKSLVGTLALSGSPVIRSTFKVLTGSLGLSGFLAKLSQRVFTARLLLTGTFTKVGGEQPPGTPEGWFHQVAGIAGRIFHNLSPERVVDTVTGLAGRIFHKRG